MQERLKEANELQLQVLETREKIIGGEHLDTLDDMSCLVGMYWNQGRSNTEDWLKKTEDLEVQIMEASKKAFGCEDLRTLETMNNIANVYWDQGWNEKELWRIQQRWKKAAELREQILETRTRVFGAAHPEVLTDTNVLGLTYRGLGMCETEDLQIQEQWKKAEELHEYVMSVRKRVLGAEHPDTLRSMIDMAFTYKMQRRHEKAEEWLTSTGDVISIYKVQGRWKEAEELEIEIMAIRDHDDEERDPMESGTMAS